MYVIVVGVKGGPYKLGVVATKAEGASWFEREVQPASPVELSILGTALCADWIDAYTKHRNALLSLSERGRRIRGEWYQPETGELSELLGKFQAWPETLGDDPEVQGWEAARLDAFMKAHGITAKEAAVTLDLSRATLKDALTQGLSKRLSARMPIAPMVVPQGVGAGEDAETAAAA